MNHKSSFDLFGFIPIFMIFCFFLLLVSAPIVGVSRVIVTQQALNQECGSNYTFLQVALAGNNLSRICQIKNQTITIK
jgi:hypothetical protein